MCDEIIQDEASCKNENVKNQLGESGGSTMSDLPRMYGSDLVDTRNTTSAEMSCEDTRITRNMANAFLLDDDSSNADDDRQQLNDQSRYALDLSKPKPYNYPVIPTKYDFQNLGTALPLVLMPTTTITAPATVNPMPPPAYYTVNDPNPWRGNFGEPTPSSMSNSDYFIANGNDNQNDYYYPFMYGMRNEPMPSTTPHFANGYVDTNNLAVGYTAPSPYTGTPQTFVIPYGNNNNANSGNYYTSLQPQNFYANLARPGVPPGIPPQFICKRDCTPTTRFPTTRCTKRPGSPQPIIAWENNNTCCCELCGIACKAQFNRGKGPQYGPCKPAPLPLPNNRNALYCHGRRRKREYYLQAPKARQRLQRESDRCRITTTTTPKPKPWPTNYPIKFRLQKSLDATRLQPDAQAIQAAHQVNNVPMSPVITEQSEKILLFENEQNNKIQLLNETKPFRSTKPHVRRNVPETASSKLRKKHNEIRMQELQETLEIALEKMNQEMNE